MLRVGDCERKGSTLSELAAALEHRDHRPMDDREARLDELLMRWQEAQETVWSRTGRDTGDGGCGLMPLTWNLSYRKLEVLVKYMAGIAEGASCDFRATYTHMRQWYWRSQWRRGWVTRPDQVTGKKRRLEEMVFRPGPGADPVRVLGALEWLSGHFPGEVYLPREFLTAQLAA